MADMGAKVFTDLGCATCHLDAGRAAARRCAASSGRRCTLASGEKVTVDEAYIRESILTPTAKLVAGYQPLMPTFQGVVSEEQIAQLTAYVKTLPRSGGRRRARRAGAGGGAGAAPAPGATPQAAGH